MEQILDLAVELAVWGSIALLIWGGALCLHAVLTGQRTRTTDRRSNRNDHSVVALATD